MSNTVDKRVVEMQFKNEDFERGVKQTIASLDSLKEALKINTNSINMSRVQREMDSLNLANVTQGVQSLTDRFSNLGVVGFTVMQRLTNEAMNLGQRLYNMSFGQIFTGGKNRAQKVADARFKLEGLMAEFEDSGKRVQSVFDSASEAVNDTAFGLDEAANIASMLVGSGVEYEKMANDVSDLDVALRGIAGAAAMSNSSFEDIGRIFAQVKTAGRLMGQDMMQLQGRTINVIAELSKYLKKSQAEVQEMVHKGQIDFNTFAAAMDNSFGAQAKKSNETLKGVLANVRAALSRIGEIFYSGIIENKSLIKFFGDLKDRINGIKATLEPLKLPFANLVASISKLGSAMLGLFDAKRAQGWKNFIDILAFVMEKLSDFIEGAAKKVDALVEKLGLKEAVEEAKEAKKVITEIDKEIKDMAWSIWYGDPEKGGRNPYGNGQARKDALGTKYEQVQKYVNAMKQANFDMEKADEIYASTVEDNSEKVVDAKERERQAREGAIKAAGQSKDQTKKMEKETNGFITMISSLVKLFQSLGKIVKSATTAFRNVFSNGIRSSGSFIVDVFSKLVDALTITDKEAEKIQTVFEGIFGIFKMVGDVLVKVVGGGFQLLASVLPYVGGALLKAAEALGNFLIRIKTAIEESVIFRTAGIAIKNAFNDATEIIKEFFTQLVNLPALKKIKEAFKDLYQKSGDKIISFFTKAAIKLKEFSDSFRAKKTEILQNALNSINSTLEFFIEIVKTGKVNIKDFLDTFKNSKGIQTVSDKIDKINSSYEQVSSTFKTFSKHNKNFKGFVASMSESVSGGGGGAGIVSKVSGFVASITLALAGLDVAKALLMGFSGAMLVFVLSLSSTVSKIGKLAKSIAGFIGGISKIFKSITKSIDSVRGYIKKKGTALIITKMALLIAVLAASIAALAYVNSKYDIMPAAKALAMIMGIMTVMVFILSKMSSMETDAESFNNIMEGYSKILVSLSGSVALLAGALYLLSTIKWTKETWKPIGVLIGLMASMFGVMAAMSKIAPQLQRTGVWMIFYAGAVLILAKALTMLASMDLTGIEQNMKVLVGCMVLIGLVALAASSLKFGSGFTIFAIVTSIILLELELKWILNHGVNGEDIINHLGSILVAVGLLGSLVALMIIVSKKCKEIKGLGVLILGTIALILSLTISLKALSKCDVGGLIAGTIALIALFWTLMSFFTVIGDMSQYKTIKNAGKSILRISAAIALLSLVMVFLGKLKPETLGQGFLAVTVLTGLMVVLMTATSLAGQIDGKGFLSLIAVMATMALLISLMSYIEDKLSLLQAAGILGLAMIAFATSIYIASNIANKVAPATIEKMILAVLAIALSLISLTVFGKDWTTILSASAALSLVILALGHCAELMSKAFASGAYNPDKQKAIHKSILSMAVLALAIGTALTAMSYFTGGNWSTLLAAAGAMTIVLAAITGVLYFVSKNMQESDTEKASKNINTLNKILIAVAVIAASMSPLLYFSHSGRQIVAAALSLSIVLAALTGVYWALSAIKADGSDMSKKALALAVASIALLPAAYALSKLAGYNWGEILPAATALGIVMIAISGALSLLTAVAQTGTGFAVVIAVALALSGTVIALAFAAKLLAGAIKTIVDAVKKLSEIDYSKIDISVLSQLVSILLNLSLTGFVAAMAIGAIGTALAVLSLGVLAIGAGVALIIASSTKLVKALTKLLEVLERITLNSKAISEGIDIISKSLSTAIKRAGIAFAMAFVVFAQTLKANAVIIASAIRDFILTGIEIIFSLKVDIGRKLIEGLIDIFDMLIEELPELFVKLNTVIILCLAELASNAAIYGMYGAIIASEFAVGIMTGLADEADDLIDTATLLTLKIMQAIRDTFDKYKNVLALSGAETFSRVGAGAWKVFKVLNLGNPLARKVADEQSSMLEENAQKAGSALDDEIDRLEKERGKKNAEAYFDGQKEGLWETNVTETKQEAKDKAEEAFDIDFKDLKEKAKGKVKDLVYGVKDEFLGETEEAVEETSYTTQKKITKYYGNLPKEAQDAFIKQYEALGWKNSIHGYMYKMVEVPSDLGKEAAETIGSIPTQAYKQMQENNYQLNDTGDQMVKSVTDGAESAVDKYGLTGVLSGDGLDWETIKSKYLGNGNASGDNYVDGIVDSVKGSENINKIKQAFSDLANEGITSYNGPEGIDANSPSKKAIQSAQYWIDGLLVSLESSTNSTKLSKAAIYNANAVSSSFASQLQNGSNNLEFTPTIRPVLDSSNMGQYGGLMNILDNPTTVKLAADSQLSIDNANQFRLGQQIDALRADINKMANTDFSKIMDGVTIDVSADTTVDGTVLRKTASSYTIGQINKKQQGYIMATGGRF